MTEENHVLPYNYCNYRCERCSDLDKCSLAAKEVVREAELIAQGKNPKDQEVLFEEVKGAFRKTAELLHNIAAKEGISLEEDWKGYSSPFLPEAYPLVKSAIHFSKSVSVMLKGNTTMAVADEAFFREQIIDLAWDTNVVPPKLYRALTGKWEAEREEDGLKEISLEDSIRSAEVALKALNNCLNILIKFSEVALNEREKVIEIINIGNNLKADLFQEFPTLKKYLL